jgi:rare lipoprotein A
MKFANKLLYAVSSAALLSSCGSINSGQGDSDIKPASALPATIGASDFPVKIGDPYKIGAISYTPQDVASYDEVGYASIYGAGSSAGPTANGEVFMPGTITAAHKTLPLPSYAEITALDTGRTILVRINDRGPYANDRLIDLSPGAAQQLGITGNGAAAVRVRKVNPPEQERTVLRNGQKASERIETPQSLLRVLRAKLDKIPRPSGARPVIAAKVPINTAPQPTRSAQTVPVPEISDDADGRFVREGKSQSRPVKPGKRAAATSPRASAPQSDGRFVREGSGANTPDPATSRATGTYAVQVASFNSRARADVYARKIGASVVGNEDGTIFRVRFGPYRNEADAQQGLATARQRGYPEAKIFRQ